MKEDVNKIDEVVEVSPPITETADDPTKVGEVKEENNESKVELTEEEFKAKDEEIKMHYAKMIFFQMYKCQIKQCCEYALKERKTIQQMKDEVEAKTSPLPSAARRMISQIDPTAFVELAKMINVDFSHNYGDDEVVTQVFSKGGEHEGN